MHALPWTRAFLASALTLALSACSGGATGGHDAMASDDGDDDSAVDQGSTGNGATPGEGAGEGGEGGANSGGSTGNGNPGTGTGAGTTGNGSTGAADACPAPGGGVTYQGHKRFMYGMNYAWDHFSADFGGIPEWGEPGVAGAKAGHLANLKDMHDHGVNVVRWWMFPDLRGQGVIVDANGTIVGLGPTTLADVNAALELAAAADVNVMLTLLSFDGFRPSGSSDGLYTHGLTGMVKDPAKRHALVENMVRPIAKAVQASPHRDRMIAWDVINEPEWAVHGSDPYGDPDFSPQGDLDSVSHAEMESLIQEMVAVIRAESTSMVTIGAAAFKWARAWSAVDQDFYQFHMYDWINQWWPYTGSPADYGLADKPLVMGEFPIGSLSGVSYSQLLDSWFANGYAGAMGWQYIEASPGDMASVKAFADAHACETRY